MFRHRSAILVVLTAPVAIAALRGGGIGLAAGWVGAGFVGAGVALRLLAIRRIGRGARVHRAGLRSGLCAAGPYRWSRNPLYLAAALMLCGLGVLAGMGWSALGLLIATLVAYTPIARHEEEVLARELGEDYRRYACETARWIGWPGPSAAEAEAPTSWREVFRRESNLVPGCLAAALAVVAIRCERLPIAALLRQWGLAGVVTIVVAILATAVVANAVSIERRRRRSAERRG